MSSELRGWALVERVRAGVVGLGEVIEGPYGRRRITYADYTATGRSLDLIEDAIREHVLPWYANTHSESSAAAAATTALREQARDAIHAAVGGTDEHAVVFCGSGTTAAVTKLVRLLDLTEDAVVFVGPYEHHSNELQWRESPAQVVAIGADPCGRIDLDQVDAELRRYADRPLRIGSFSAASNVTGMLSDTDAIAAMLHRHGALSCWDYAAAGPYLPIRMGESRPGAGDHKDAVFLSPHKFLGGPQTPGVLVVRRELLERRVPTVPGGGVISFVNPEGQWYLDDPVAREEGGTPAIVESIRAGLVFALREAIGTDLIGALDERHYSRALRVWGMNPNLQILGNVDAPRLPIVSFRVRHGFRYLHHHFVVALLNDLFGIQARGGCSCAGPYGHRLLEIEPARSRAIQAQVERGYFGAKPGWARVNFHFTMTDAAADFIIAAVDLVARYGHRLLTDYRFDPATGHWHHHSGLPQPPVRLDDLLTAGGPRRPYAGEDELPHYLDRARDILLAPRPDVDTDAPDLPADFEALREFELPGVCVRKGTLLTHSV